MVLVAVDGSEGSRKAARFAGGLAKNVGARLLLIHVVQRWPVGAMAEIDVSPEDYCVRQLAFGQQMLQDVGNEIGFPNAEMVIEIGWVPEAICAEAESRNVDMIVLGAHGHGSGGRLTTGSVGTRVAMVASRTVTVVR